MNYINRQLTKELINELKTRPLIYLNGARQVGKSTLCMNLPKNIKLNHFTFDSPILLVAAKSDPANFVENLPDDILNVIDEVQFAPEIFSYLKMKVDNNRLKGINKQMFLLTGSANLMALPQLSEAFVGRMSVLTLYPFSACEYSQTNISCIQKFFTEDLKIKKYEKYDILDIISHSTYPEIAINNEIDKTKWFDDYLTTILNRDVKSISDLKNPNLMISLLSILSTRTGGLLNNTEIAREIGVDYKTYEKMLAFALNSFLIFNINSWAKPNKLNKRFTKSPKLYFTDCNLLLYIMKRKIENIFNEDKQIFGHLFENFVATELLKQAKINHIELSHYRTSTEKEVDFVLENTNGDVIGIEVKASKSLNTKFQSGLNDLKALCGEKFKKGIVLYLGQEIIPLAEKIWAVPVCYLWK